jgi:hypothetical protein
MNQMRATSPHNIQIHPTARSEIRPNTCKPSCETEEYHYSAHTTSGPSRFTFESHDHMSNSRTSLSHSIHEQRTHRSGKLLHPSHAFLFLHVFMHTKLIVRHSRRLHCRVTHNHYNKPQNPYYFNPSTIGRLELKICQVAPTSYQPNLVTLPTHLTYPTHLKKPIKSSYTRTTHSQARNLQPSPQMFNAVDTHLVIPPIHHTHLKNLAKDNFTTTSHTHVDHLQVTLQKPNPEKIDSMLLLTPHVYLLHLTNPAIGKPTPTTYTQTKHLKLLYEKTNSTNIAHLQCLQSSCQNDCRILPKTLNRAPTRT